VAVKEALDQNGFTQGKFINNNLGGRVNWVNTVFEMGPADDGFCLELVFAVC